MRRVHLLASVQLRVSYWWAGCPHLLSAAEWAAVCWSAVEHVTLVWVCLKEETQHSCRWAARAATHGELGVLGQSFLMELASVCLFVSCVAVEMCHADVMQDGVYKNITVTVVFHIFNPGLSGSTKKTISQRSNLCHRCTNMSQSFLTEFWHLASSFCQLDQEFVY